jgi:hypothetical protein
MPLFEYQEQLERPGKIQRLICFACKHSLTEMQQIEGKTGIIAARKGQKSVKINV